MDIQMQHDIFHMISIGWRLARYRVVSESNYFIYIEQSGGVLFSTCYSGFYISRPYSLRPSSFLGIKRLQSILKKHLHIGFGAGPKIVGMAPIGKGCILSACLHRIAATGR